jgi:hypothetical protein
VRDEHSVPAKAKVGAVTVTAKDGSEKNPPLESARSPCIETWLRYAVRTSVRLSSCRRSQIGPARNDKACSLNAGARFSKAA